MKLYMFRAGPLPIIRSLFIVYSALVYVIQVWRQLSSRTWSYSTTVLYAVRRWPKHRYAAHTFFGHKEEYSEIHNRIYSAFHHVDVILARISSGQSCKQTFDRSMLQCIMFKHYQKEKRKRKKKVD